MTYVTDAQIEEIADALQDHYNFGLISTDPVPKILPYVYDELRERGLPMRRSLAIVIAKVTQAKYYATIMQVKRLQEEAR